MNIKLFCWGSKKLAIKYRYYMKYNMMLVFCVIAPIVLYILNHNQVIVRTGLKLSSSLLAFLLFVWCIILLLGCIGFGNVNALQYQIFGITEENQLIHFWFKDMLKDGKVVLRFTPYRKKNKKEEYIEVVKRKEEIMKDENLEEYLRTLLINKEVQQKSDILFEVMQDITVIKETRQYLALEYSVGVLGTKKRLRIYKNISNFDEIKKVVR